MHEFQVGSTVRVIGDDQDVPYTLARIEEKGKKTKLAHLEDEFGGSLIVAMSHLALPRTKAPKRKRKYGVPAEMIPLLPSPDNHPAENVAVHMGCITHAYQSSIEAEKKRTATAHREAAFHHAVLALNIPSTLPKPGLINRVLGVSMPNPLHVALHDAVLYHLGEAESAK